MRTSVSFNRSDYSGSIAGMFDNGTSDEEAPFGNFHRSGTCWRVPLRRGCSNPPVLKRGGNRTVHALRRSAGGQEEEYGFG